MAVDERVIQVAAAWRPQRPGRRGPGDIADALVEPEWGGARVVAALTPNEAALYRDGQELAVPEEMLQALLDGFGAVDAIVEGHVTTEALRTGEGAFPLPATIERPPILVPRVFRASVKDDPYVVGRDHEADSEKHEPVTIDALARGERHAFVATDLLWLDGQSLDRCPVARAEAPPRGGPGRVVPGPGHGVRAPDGADDARVVGHARVQRDLVPGLQQPVPGRRGQPRLGDRQEPAHAHALAAEGAAALTADVATGVSP